MEGDFAMHSHDEDDVLLNVLRNFGVDFDRNRELNFYFVFPSESDADRAAGMLAQKQIASEKFRIDPPWWKRLFAKPQWSLSVTREMALDEAKIKQITTTFSNIASRCNGEYDGWEANVMDDNIAGQEE